jgi:hypothetical protein
MNSRIMMINSGPYQLKSNIQYIEQQNYDDKQRAIPAEKQHSCQA